MSSGHDPAPEAAPRAAKMKRVVNALRTTNLATGVALFAVRSTPTKAQIRRPALAAGTAPSAVSAAFSESALPRSRTPSYDEPEVSPGPESPSGGCCSPRAAIWMLLGEPWSPVAFDGAPWFYERSPDSSGLSAPSAGV